MTTFGCYSSSTTEYCRMPLAVVGAGLALGLLYLNVRTGPPVGVGIGSLPMTPNKNGEIGVLCVESVLAGTGRHNKT